MKHEFGAIVIGTGQAGPPLARRLAAAGTKVAIIERARFGGTCVNTGCIPTKTQVASAYAAHMARRAAEYGVTIAGGVTVDMKRVKARKDEVSGASRTGLEQSLNDLQNGQVFRGHASFESPTEVRVADDILAAPQVFINVGARATIPAIPGLKETPHLTNSSILELDFAPRHLAILGGSYIGLEFGQMYRRFGSQVTILERAPHLIPNEDEETSQAVREILEAEGIAIVANAQNISVTRKGEDIIIGTEVESITQEIRASHLLVALGRTPNTHDLGLDRAGVNVDKDGYIVVDDQLRTNVPGIWALGDCNGRGGFTHTSYNDFEIVAANLLDGASRRVSDRITAYNLYIDPPLGRVGMSETEARASGRRVLVGRRPMTRVGRAVEKGETQGFMKAVVDADTKQILGAAILGVSGDEAIHCILDTMYARAPYTTLQQAVHIHPTVSELIPTILGELK